MPQNNADDIEACIWRKVLAANLPERSVRFSVNVRNVPASLPSELFVAWVHDGTNCTTIHAAIKCAPMLLFTYKRLWGVLHSSLRTPGMRQGPATDNAHHIWYWRPQLLKSCRYLQTCRLIGKMICYHKKYTIIMCITIIANTRLYW